MQSNQTVPCIRVFLSICLFSATWFRQEIEPLRRETERIGLMERARINLLQIRCLRNGVMVASISYEGEVLEVNL